MKLKINYFAAGLAIFAMAIQNLFADNGTTTIAKWKDNKKGAFTLRFDDSMMSHKDHTVPNLVKRGLAGSFFLNPATNRYGYGIDVWESLAGRAGLEVCPHTMNHTGAADLAEADYEISQAFNYIWTLNPPDKSKLYPFDRGGATTWPDGYMEAVQSKYPFVNYRSEAVSYNGADSKTDLINFAKKAMNDDAWHIILTHGTGPNLEWLGFEVSNFEALLDFLVTVKDGLWISTAGDTYKYIMERKSATVGIIEENQNLLRLELKSDTDPLLFDYPLTLISEVPASWNYCHVRQGDLQHIYPVNSGRVMYEAVPGRGEIVLRSSVMDTSVPGKVTVNDGSAVDIDESPFVHQVSANWSAADDGESGIARYWYRIGTTPGGSEVVDWIDNGLERTVTTTRTKFSLVRGEKYFVTVKVVNGAGLESESVSDGFIVNTIPGHISFLENFDAGYLSQWNEKFARTGSTSNLLYTSVKAARDGKYGLQVHLAANNRNTPRIIKQEVAEAKDIFTRLYFKLDKDFKMPAEGSLQILELKDAGGEFVAGVYLGYREGIGFHVYALYLDDTGYRASLPGIS
ncbi:MAG TPA: hypothetical protein VI583_10060, partial [Cyclobacteriaceae bacterium]|nr:hypothetical protein [Cyclobacteriaceae bacterium]